MSTYKLDTKNPSKTDWQIKGIVSYFYLGGFIAGLILGRII